MYDNEMNDKRSEDLSLTRSSRRLDGVEAVTAVGGSLGAAGSLYLRYYCVILSITHTVHHRVTLASSRYKAV